MDNAFIKVKGVKTLQKSQCVSFSVFPGETVCLFGMNGSGKTLLLKTICGIFSPFEGMVETYIDKSRRGVCLQFPEHLVFNETALAEAVLITESEKKARSLLADIGADPVQSPFFMSDGQKRLLFIYGLLETKDILIFDEPFASLDGKTVQKVAFKMSEAKGKGKAIVYTANRKRDLFCANKTINIEKLP